MQNYELVLLLDPKTSDAEKKELLDALEKSFPNKEKDEIWVHELSFHLKDGSNRAYFVSYYLELTPEQIVELKAMLLYNPILIKYELYKMTSTQQFFHFKDLQTHFDKALEEIKDTKYGQKLNFFADKKNAKYIYWKSLPMLQLYLTRFGNIKPRNYTSNSVATQKKLRQEIIRARTLGMLNFISR